MASENANEDVISEETKPTPTSNLLQLEEEEDEPATPTPSSPAVAPSSLVEASTQLDQNQDELEKREIEALFEEIQQTVPRLTSKPSGTGEAENGIENSVLVKKSDSKSNKFTKDVKPEFTQEIRNVMQTNVNKMVLALNNNHGFHSTPILSVSGELLHESQDSEKNSDTNDTPKRRRGRPRKNSIIKSTESTPKPNSTTIKRKRGRPRKSSGSTESVSSVRTPIPTSSPTGRKERCRWSIEENKKLLDIVSSGKTSVDEIYEELAKSKSNIKTYEEVKNKRMNLLARVTSSKNILVVLEEDITKQQEKKISQKLMGSVSQNKNNSGVTENSVKRGPGRPRKQPKLDHSNDMASQSSQDLDLEEQPVYTKEIRSQLEELRSMIQEQTNLLLDLRKEFHELKDTELTSIEDDSTM